MAEEAITVLRERGSMVKVDWVIRNFCSLPHRLGQKLKSPIFRLKNANWFLEIYPKGMITRSVDDIYLFLVRDKIECKHHAEVEISMKVTDNFLIKQNFKWLFTNEHISAGPYKLHKISDLEDYMLRTQVDTVTFECELNIYNYCDELVVHVKESASQASLTGGVDTLIEHFKDLFLAGRQSDITLQVGSQQFKAHRLILAARSPIFGGMFEHDRTETFNEVIEISDCDPNTFHDFLIYLYTGKLDHVTSDNALGLYKTAVKYDTKELKGVCSQCMLTGISIDSVLDIIDLAVHHGEFELLKKATDVFTENTATIFLSTKWGTFLRTNPQVANELLIKSSND